MVHDFAEATEALQNMHGVRTATVPVLLCHKVVIFLINEPICEPDVRVCKRQALRAMTKGLIGYT